MSTRVDFHILTTPSLESVWQKAFELLETIYASIQPIWVELPDQERATQFDDQLWTFRESSFVPHSMISSDIPAPIRIGTAAAPLNQAKTWINLAYRDLNPEEQYSHIIEIVPEQQNIKEAARIRFRQYRQLGYECVTHQLG